MRIKKDQEKSQLGGETSADGQADADEQHAELHEDLWRSV